MLWSVCFFALRPIVLKLSRRQNSLEFLWADVSRCEARFQNWSVLVLPNDHHTLNVGTELSTEMWENLHMVVCPRNYRMGGVNEVVADTLVAWHRSQIVECLRYSCVLTLQRGVTSTARHSVNITCRGVTSPARHAARSHSFVYISTS